MSRVNRIARFSLTSADPARLADFYERALGFVGVGVRRIDAGIYGVRGQAMIHLLRLGQQEIELVGFGEQGAPYPERSTSHDVWFQHLALVTTDMGAARARLGGIGGWETITTGGRPVVLPASSGGVAAFKFRDPEGHPLELLQFPADRVPDAWSGQAVAGPVIGIDHSAIVVTDSARSVTFYGELGLVVGSGSLNQGGEQEALDGAGGVQVGVTGLEPPDAPPHLELLAYRSPVVRAGSVGAADVAATRTILAGADRPRMLVDPDGHRLVLEADGAG